jgi:hypothetical protein
MAKNFCSSFLTLKSPKFILGHSIHGLSFECSLEIARHSDEYQAHEITYIIIIMSINRADHLADH